MSEIKKQWYVVRAIGGKEGKVKEYIEAEIRHNHLEDYISQVLIPTEKVYTIRNGKKVSKEKVSYPGYVLVEAAFVGQIPIIIRNTPNVLGFLGDTKEDSRKMNATPFIKLQIKGGAANPSPPVGPALGSKGVNIMDFCKQFNARTQDKAGKVLPVIITVYSDKSFDFVVKQPPVAIQLKEAAKVQKGSAQPNRDKVGQVTWDQIREIAQDKMPDMNCFTLESAMRMVAGTARSMGISVVGEFPNM